MISLLTAKLSRSRSNQRDMDWLYSRIEGLPGGAESMELFAEPNSWNQVQTEMNAFHEARNPGSMVKYPFNENLWCHDMLPLLTGAYVGFKWQGNKWMNQYGTTLITPQHVVCCVHAGTPHLGTQYRWTDIDGYAVDNTMIARVLGNSTDGIETNFGTEQSDISIGLLATPMPVGVVPFRIAPQSLRPGVVGTFARSQTCLEGQITATGGARPPYTQETWPESKKYPRANQTMLHITPPNNIFRTENRDDWRYVVWPGDSGTPQFTYKNGEVLLTGMIGSNTFSGYGSPVTPTCPKTIDYLNRMIAAVNAKAIAEGLVTSVNPSYIAQEASEYA